MKDPGDDKIKDLLKAVYRPEPASPEYKERLRQRLVRRVKAGRKSTGSWWHARLWAPVVATIALVLVSYNIWQAFSLVPIEIASPSGVVSQAPGMIEVPTVATEIIPVPGSTSQPLQEEPSITIPEVTPAAETAPADNFMLAVQPVTNPGGDIPSEPSSEAIPEPSPKYQPTTIPPATKAQATPATGRLEVRVTDAPGRPEVTGIFITVASVEIHRAGVDVNSGWFPLKITADHTFNLLEIWGLESVLASSDLTPSSYNQIRMDVTNVEVILNNQQQTAILPSGKLKFVQSFEVSAGNTTILLFDFDALKSIALYNNGKVYFKPSVKLSVNDKTATDLQITSPNLPAGEVGKTYNATLIASGGKAPYVWSIASGTLPRGITLNPATGLLSGKPTTAGSTTLTVKVTDKSTVMRSATRSITVTINSEPQRKVEILTQTLPAGKKGSAYVGQIRAMGCLSPSWSISSGKLPDGLSLNAKTGLISGIPPAAGDFTFTVQVKDSEGQAGSDTRVLTIHITDPWHWSWGR
jgi:hypothetical protein